MDDLLFPIFPPITPARHNVDQDSDTENHQEGDEEDDAKNDTEKSEDSDEGSSEVNDEENDAEEQNEDVNDQEEPPDNTGEEEHQPDRPQLRQPYQQQIVNIEEEEPEQFQEAEAPVLQATQEQQEEHEQVQGAAEEHEEQQEEYEQVQGAAAAVLKDQSKKPSKGDTIAFVRGNFWIRAKIRNKVSGYHHYYNVVYEDGMLDGLYLKPPADGKTESWTFIDPNLWSPSPIDNDTISIRLEDQGIAQLDGANTPESLSPSSGTETNPTPPPIWFAAPGDILKAPIVMGRMVIDDIEPTEDLITRSNDISLDWDNYNSDPTYLDQTADAHDLNISSDTTGSDVFILQHTQAVDHHEQPVLDDVPPLHRRADRVISVINCGAGTCKRKYQQPPPASH